MSVQTEITRIQTAKRAISEAIGGKGVEVPPTAKLDDLAALVALIQAGNDTSDATATAAEIFDGQTAYVASGKVTGKFTIDRELTDQGSKIAAIMQALSGKAMPKSGGSESLIIAGRLNLTEDTVCTTENPVTISHNLGARPTFFMLARIGEPRKGPGFNFYNLSAIQTGDALSVNGSYHAQYPEVYSLSVTGALTDAAHHASNKSAMDVWGATETDIKLGAIKSVTSQLPAGTYLWIAGREN